METDFMDEFLADIEFEEFIIARRTEKNGRTKN
ncbi:MAG: hypothetical protein QS98_C0010G0057 [archaeon GW2011_AR3]|nr:MAG: hypothetical protein QS98_C0010G0057 [archaeon GW2011_AR3]